MRFQAGIFVWKSSNLGLPLRRCKWSEVKGIQSEKEIEYSQEKGLKCDKWSDMKGFWSAGKSSIYREKVRKLLSEVKWIEGILKLEEIEYFLEQGLESDKWREVKGIEVGWRSANCGKGKGIGGVGCEVYIRVVGWSEV